METKPGFETGSKQYEAPEGELYNQIDDAAALAKIAEIIGEDATAQEARQYVGGVVQRLKDQIGMGWDDASEAEKVALVEEEIVHGTPLVDAGPTIIEPSSPVTSDVKAGSEAGILDRDEVTPDVPAGSELGSDVLTGGSKFNPEDFAPPKK